MPTAHVTALNHTIQLTEEWLSELARKSVFGNGERAYTGLRAVLHSLRDRLTVEEAVHFSAQLPMLVRGFYFEGWKTSLAPNREETEEEFLYSVRESLKNASLDMDEREATQAVLEFLERRIDPGQMKHVKGQMPKEIQQLWAGVS